VNCPVIERAYQTNQAQNLNPKPKPSETSKATETPSEWAPTRIHLVHTGTGNTHLLATFIPSYKLSSGVSFVHILQQCKNTYANNFSYIGYPIATLIWY
jgi:hypothetical protein